MRDYAKIGPKMWHGQTFKALRQRGIEGVVVATYLMTSPSSNMLGLYFQPLMYMAYETGLGIEGASKGLQDCIDVGFCQYDETSEMVWVVEMANYQIANELQASDKRCKGIQKDYEALPDNPFIGLFFDRYQLSFHLATRREFEGASQGPSKPHRSKEKEKEKEKEQEKDKKTMSVSTDLVAAPPENPRPQKSEVDEIFAYWQKRMESPRSKLDDKRRKAIKAALAMGYKPEDLCRAIRGCSKTPHNMGKNDQKQKYNGIELILRNADQIDRFIGNDTAPPVPVQAGQPSQADLDRINAEAYALTFGKPQGEIIDV